MEGLAIRVVIRGVYTIARGLLSPSGSPIFALRHGSKPASPGASLTPP
jgi:hypothetical protein